MRKTLAILSLFGAVAFCTAAAQAQFAPMALNSFSATPDKILAAKVFDQAGKEIGSVYQVRTDPQGKPISLEIRLADGAMMTVASINASYEAATNVVVARTPAQDTPVTVPPVTTP